MYFWESDPEAPELAIDIARFWARMRTHRESFPDDKSVVFIAEFADDAEVLDLRRGKHQLALLKFARAYEERLDAKLSHGDKCLICDEFIRIFEKKIGCSVAIVKAADEIPQLDKLTVSSFNVLPYYQSLIVRDLDVLTNCHRI